jgi:hypothetical protein
LQDWLAGQLSNRIAVGFPVLTAKSLLLVTGFTKLVKVDGVV